MRISIKPIRVAFTLVELLVVIAIIGILAGMSITVVQGVRETARISATNARITKLDAAITEMYESYQYRRIDVDISNLPSGLRNPRDVAEVRLWYLCQTMRMEMPQNWDEVTASAIPSFKIGVNGTTVNGLDPAQSALRNSYLAAYDAALADLTSSSGGGLSVADAEALIVENGSAELLYQIVTIAIPEMREMLHQQEIGDIDDDGLPEFHDAWGNPICFVRWAAAFPDSDRQPNIAELSGYLDTNSLPNDGMNATFWGDIKKAFVAKIDNDEDFREHFLNRYADPVDPLQARYCDSLDSGSTARINFTGWLLVPLIVSPGPDGELGLGIGVAGGGAVSDHDDPFVNWGMPDNYSGNGFTHQDNIHNHRVQNQQWGRN